MRTAAWPNTTEILRFIPHPYLTEFYACFKTACQYADQTSEVNTLICCKVKDQFFAVHCILGIHKIHFQVFGLNGFSAKTYCFVSHRLIFVIFLQILFCCPAHEMTIGFYDIIFGYFIVFLDNTEQSHAPLCFCNYIIIPFHLLPAVFEINILEVVKMGGNDEFDHNIFNLSSRLPYFQRRASGVHWNGACDLLSAPLPAFWTTVLQTACLLSSLHHKVYNHRGRVMCAAPV